MDKRDTKLRNFILALVSFMATIAAQGNAVGKDIHLARRTKKNRADHPSRFSRGKMTKHEDNLYVVGTVANFLLLLRLLLQLPTATVHACICC